MDNVVPLIAERFPEIRDEILRLRFREPRLDELCRDYDEVMHSLDAGKANHARADTEKADAETIDAEKTVGARRNASNQELLEEIAAKLEAELLLLFAVINTNKSRGGSE